MKKLLSLFVSLFLLQLLSAQNSPVANNDSFSINKNNQVTLPVLSNDFDIDGDSLVLSILTPPMHGSAAASGNQITYLPTLNYVGNDSFTYVICDSTGLCDTAIVFIIINAVNNAPVAVNDTFVVPQNVGSTLPVTSNDYEPDGETLTVTILTGPVHGTASVSNGTQVIYTPMQFYYGMDSFVYVVCDPFNLCDTANVYITVSGSNLPPVGTDDNYSFSDTLTTATLAVIANDYEPENQSFSITLVIDRDTTNNLGTLSIDTVTNLLVFNRNGISCGTEVFEYVICDYNSCDTAEVSVSITCPENIFLSEGFSPDGDGINDKLVFPRLEYFSPAFLKVFNRYGTLVYENEDYKNDWEGTSLNSNNVLPDGTYFYVLKLADKREYNNYLIINR
jgi:gliding motility-associated-like protein